MDFYYIIRYTDKRFTDELQTRRIRTSNIKMFIEDFEKNDLQYIKVISYTLVCR